MGLDASSRYLGRLFAMRRDQLQATCQAPSDADVLALPREHWGHCWAWGSGSRTLMLLTIAAAMKAFGRYSKHAYVAYITQLILVCRLRSGGGAFATAQGVVTES